MLARTESSDAPYPSIVHDFTVAETINHELGPMLEWGPKGPPLTCIGHVDDVHGTCVPAS
jgi:hypothetical protein